MYTQDNRPIVPIEITIGGNLPRKSFDTFITHALRLYDEEPNEFTYKKEYKDRIRNALQFYINEAEEYNQPLTLKTNRRSGEPNQDFLLFCAFNGLKFHYRVAPHIDQDGNHINERVILYGRGKIQTIPTNGNLKPVTEVDTLFDKLEEIFDTLDLDPESDPTRINDKDLRGEIARRRMSGEALRKMLPDLLRSFIGYQDFIVPYFHVV